MVASDVLDEEIAKKLAELFSAFSDPSRLRLISVLVQAESNVGSLAEAVGLSESATSHQLRGLRQIRLVATRKEGREVYYRLDDEHIKDLYMQGLTHLRHD